MNKKQIKAFILENRAFTTEVIQVMLIRAGQIGVQKWYIDKILGRKPEGELGYMQGRGAA